MENKKYLILFASAQGQTAKIANFMAGELNKKNTGSADIFDLRNAKNNDGKKIPAADSLSCYKKIIICGSINMGGYHKSIKKFISNNRQIINNTDSILVTVCLAVMSKNQKDRDQAVSIAENFAKKMDWQPLGFKYFAGALPYTKYNPLIRFVMKKISEKEGSVTDTTKDHEFTNWSDVKKFCESI